MFTLELTWMFRRLLFLAIAILAGSALSMDAQLLGTGSQSTDCSNPANASSPACAGTPSDTTGAGYQQQPGAYGTGAAPGAYPQQGQQNGVSPMGGQTGINGNVPTYVDRIPYGRQFNGAYPNPYNPYANFYNPYYQQPLTEFQRVVAGAVGAILPVFGSDLFVNASQSFSPIDRTPVTSDYIVGPGDQLLIRVWGQVNFNAHVTVDRAGQVYVPQVGNVQVAGLHFEQLDGYLKKQFSRVFRNFDLSVNMGQLRSIQVFVVGNARRPGSYTVSSLSTLVNALFSSGGPSEQGSMRDIELKRGGKIITTLDLYDLLIRGDKSHDAALLPGDVIYIPPVGAEMAVAGSVHIPAIYELKGTETAGQAIGLAGGLSTMASKKDAQLDRTDNQGARHTIQLALDSAGLETPLRDGDILRVPSIVQRFQSTVTLRGNVANPGRYRWKAGMRILDLIPDQASLETRGYWERRVALGLPAPEYFPLFKAYQATLPQPGIPPASSRRMNSNSQNGPSGSQGQAQSAQNAGSAQNSGSQSTTGTPPTDYTTGTSVADTQDEGLAGVPPNGTYPNGNGTNGVAGQTPYPGQSSPNAQMQQPQQQNRNGFGAVSGPVRELVPQLKYFPPGQRYSQAQFPIQNEILRTAPSIDWSYAVIERTNPHTLATSLVPFNLGQAVLDHNADQNLKLEPGDIISVFSTADVQVPQAQQIKYVRLEGEVVHGGIYSVQAGETLRDLVRRAGGLTPNAYLFGSEFLRESTQRLQQARLNEYVNSLQRDIQLSSSNASGSIVNATGAAALGNSIQSQQQLIVTLRRMRATGRIVLDLTPYSRGVDALPNLRLEDGDRFIVPTIPSAVNVVGAVYDQNSFLYQRGMHVGTYLKTAGGTTRNADRRHEFVIRADGSVVSKQTAGGTIFMGGFDSQFAYPGDTVVVPDNVNKTTVLRGLTDWSTVFSQFGLGIAALTLFGL